MNDAEEQELLGLLREILGEMQYLRTVLAPQVTYVQPQPQVYPTPQPPFYPTWVQTSSGSYSVSPTSWTWNAGPSPAGGPGEDGGTSGVGATIHVHPAGGPAGAALTPEQVLEVKDLLRQNDSELLNQIRQHPRPA